MRFSVGDINKIEFALWVALALLWAYVFDRIKRRRL